MLEQLQFSVCALGQDRRAEGLHDLLDGHGLARELILGRAARNQHANGTLSAKDERTKRGQRRPYPLAAGQCTFAMSAGPISQCGVPAHLLVISNVVPKI